MNRKTKIIITMALSALVFIASFFLIITVLGGMTFTVGQTVKLIVALAVLLAAFYWSTRF